MSRAISEGEFNEWLQHPVTRELKKILEARREARRQTWEGGSYTDWDKNTTVLINVGNIGECKGYAFVSELDYEGYVMEIDDGPREQVGPVPSGSGSVDSDV